MSIAPTRKVSGSVSPSHKTGRSYAQGNGGEPFVEMIDTNNSVSIHDDLQDNHNQNSSDYQKTEDEEEKSKISSGSTYIPSAIEALTASGVYDQNQVENRHLKVGVYDNNQTIVQEQEDNRNGQNYLKHLYEKNSVVKEVDEFA